MERSSARPSTGNAKERTPDGSEEDDDEEDELRNLGQDLLGLTREDALKEAIEWTELQGRWHPPELGPILRQLHALHAVSGTKGALLESADDAALAAREGAGGGGGGRNSATHSDAGRSSRLSGILSSSFDSAGDSLVKKLRAGLSADMAAQGRAFAEGAAAAKKAQMTSVREAFELCLKKTLSFSDAQSAVLSGAAWFKMEFMDGIVDMCKDSGKVEMLRASFLSYDTLVQMAKDA
jgi:hypothetical protein